MDKAQEIHHVQYYKEQKPFANWKVFFQSEFPSDKGVGDNLFFAADISFPTVHTTFNLFNMLCMLTNSQDGVTTVKYIAYRMRSNYASFENICFVHATQH